MKGERGVGGGEREREREGVGEKQVSDRIMVTYIQM